MHFKKTRSNKKRLVTLVTVRNGAFKGLSSTGSGDSSGDGGDSSGDGAQWFANKELGSRPTSLPCEPLCDGPFFVTAAPLSPGSVTRLNPFSFMECARSPGFSEKNESREIGMNMYIHIQYIHFVGGIPRLLVLGPKGRV
jgi:hypothetical protein